jgi:hypothetical protein
MPNQIAQATLPQSWLILFDGMNLRQIASQSYGSLFV